MNLPTIKSLTALLLSRICNKTKAALRNAQRALFLTSDTIALTTRSNPSNNSLVIRLDAIGDYFVWLQSGAVDVSRYARKNSGKAMLLANRTWSNHAKNSGLWDEVIDADPGLFLKSPIYRVSLLRQLRKYGFLYVIQPRAARLFLLEDSIVRLCTAANKIGNNGVLFNSSFHLRKKGNHFYDKLFEVSENLNIHETVRNREFTHQLTGIAVTKFAFNLEQQILNKKSVLVVVGAGWSGRVWPVKKLIKLIQHLQNNKPQYSFVLAGAASDAGMALDIEQALSGKIENLVGTTSLEMFVALIESSTLVICNESSAYHIAMALNKNVMAFVGGGHFGWFAPYPDDRKNAHILNAAMDCYGCNWRCKYPTAKQSAVHCIESIELHRAIDLAQSILR